MKRIPGNDDDDSIGNVTEGIIPVDEVSGVFVQMTRESFDRYGKKRWVLEMSVAFPEEYHGTILKMFLQDYDGKIPVTSGLYQAASVAMGKLEPRQRVTKTAFLNRMFRARTRLAVPRNGSAPYTVIDCLLEKLTG